MGKSDEEIIVDPVAVEFVVEIALELIVLEMVMELEFLEESDELVDELEFLESLMNIRSLGMRVTLMRMQRGLTSPF